MPPELAILSAVLVASLVGSPHCAGMCGGLMLFALGADKDQPKGRRVRLQLAYHGGRLASYLALGAGAGAIGAAIDFGGRFAGVQRAAAIVAGAMMITFGLALLARAAGLRTGRLRLPKTVTAVLERAHRLAFTLRPTSRALAIGLLTALLPCGWLYAFAFTAAGTASPLMGAAVLGTFWVGTVPLMALLGAGIQLLTRPLHAHLPLITGLAVTAVGVYTALGRLHAPAMTPETLHLTDTAAVPMGPDCPLCHPDE
jgi:sulfite exporter TauE/SafE